MSHVSAPTELLPTEGEPALVTQAGRRAVNEQFDRIMRVHGPAISRLASSYEQVTSRREELAQDIALAIWQALHHFRGECSERTFVFRIAHNRGLTHAWKRKPSLESLEDLPEHHHPIDPRPHPEDATAQKSRRAALMAAIHSLPVMHRQMILLLLEDLSYADMAEVLGITETNVAVRLNRARKALKQALEERS